LVPGVISTTTKRVVASVSSYYELAKIVPRLNTLRETLAKCQYGPDSGTQQKATKLLTFRDISKLIQASDSELMQGLNDINAFELNGYWRVLSPSFATDIVDLLLTNATINGWSFSDIDETTVLSTMHEYDSKILLHILAMYGTKANAKWQLDLKKLSIFRAKQLLTLGEKGKSGDWRLADFITSWQDSIPEGAPVDIELLRGLAVVVQQGKETMLHYLSAVDLCSIADPKERLQRLFKVQAQWTLNDLLPYLADLAPNSTAVQSIVLKHARAVATATGATFYCVREL
jgi:sister chromatid cohesion protein DCC1